MTPITVRTRSCNRELYDKMRSFIPEDVECVAHTAYDDWTTAATFLHDSIMMTDGILVICDEDCFISDFSQVAEIASVVESNNYLAAGMPDGGVSTHRCHSFVTLNPFFLILNAGLIKSKDGVREEMDHAKFKPKFEDRKPPFVLGNYNHNNTEPFAGIFYWLFDRGNFLFLNGATLGDGLSTELKGLDNRPFCYHAWMSREYNNNPKDYLRINNLYNYALLMKK